MDKSDFTHIVGTAGHIDHGKTTLVRALTGTDTDRLPEEKLRGMTIDLGFAELDLGTVRLGVVDVPGHERFIRNMFAGSASIDIALLVVAADDGVMPQTREHLEILNLLDVRRGVIAITKCDTRTAEWIDMVIDDVRDLIRGTFLEDAEIIRTAAPPGMPANGLDQLRHALRGCSLKNQGQPSSELFRLPIDRSFSIAGRGTVVTGSVWSGVATVGDELQLHPSGMIVRVRHLENHGRQVNHVQRGQRAAMNLGGIRHTEITRGHEVATPGYLKASRLLSAQLQVLASSLRPVKDRSRQRLYLGTQEVMVGVALLNRRILEPGETGLAQLTCHTPTMAVCGQPFVIREESPRVTIGGGRVLQATATRIHRRSRDQQARVMQMNSASVDVRMDCALYFKGATPWHPFDLCRDANVTPATVDNTLDKLRANERLVEISVQSQDQLVHCDVIAELGHRMLRVVNAAQHKTVSFDPGISRQQLVSRFSESAETPIVHAVIDRLLANGELETRGSNLSTPGQTPRLSRRKKAQLDEIVARLDQGGATPPTLDMLSAILGEPIPELQSFLKFGVGQRLVVQIAPDIFVTTVMEDKIRSRITSAITERGPLTLAQIKDVLGTSRKYAVPICEYLDKIGLTRRIGNLRTLA